MGLDGVKKPGFLRTKKPGFLSYAQPLVVPQFEHL